MVLRPATETGKYSKNTLAVTPPRKNHVEYVIICSESCRMNHEFSVTVSLIVHLCDYRQNPGEMHRLSDFLMRVDGDCKCQNPGEMH